MPFPISTKWIRKRIRLRMHSQMHVHNVGKSKSANPEKFQQSLAWADSARKHVSCTICHIPPTPKHDTRAFWHPRRSDLFCSMVLPGFLQFCADQFQEVPESCFPEKSGHLTLDLTISSAARLVCWPPGSPKIEQLFKLFAFCKKCSCYDLFLFWK